MDIYLINVKEANNISDEILQKFNFKHYKQWKIHSLAYLMADRILRDIYKIKNPEIVFDLRKPILKSGEKHFSIAHSGEYIALAFADSNCGIDIEKVKNRDYKAISKRMKFKSESLEDFYYNWTEYEANYKLGYKYVSCYLAKINDYILTAVSAFGNEKYELYFS